MVKVAAWLSALRLSLGIVLAYVSAKRAVVSDRCIFIKRPVV